MKRVIPLFIMVFALYSTPFYIDLQAGWNLTSTPLESVPSDSLDGEVIGRILSFDTVEREYNPTVTLSAGTGYWVLSPIEQSIIVYGTIDTCLTYSSLLPGWNMLGSPYSPISASDYIAHYSDTTDIVRPLFYYNPDSTRYQELEFLTAGTGFWLLSGDTVSLDSCVNSANLPGSPLWTVEIDSAAQYYRNISSPSLDEEGNIYFSEHLDMDYAADTSNDDGEYFALYKFNSSGTMLWNVRRDDNAHFKHNPTPVIDKDRETAFCAGGPYCYGFDIYSSSETSASLITGQGHYVGDPAIGCEYRILSRFNSHGRLDTTNTNSILELYNHGDTYLLDTFDSLSSDMDVRLVTGPIIDHKGRLIAGTNFISTEDDSIHAYPYNIHILDIVSDAFVFVDSIKAGSFAKYSSFALDTNSSGNTRIFAGSMDGLVYAFLDEGDSLHKLFEIVLGGTINSNPVINSDGIMYVGSADANTLQNGRLWALDIDSLITLGGTLDTSYAIWHYPDSGFLEGGIYGSPTIGDDGVIYFGETEGEGYLYAISDHGDSAHFEWRYRRDSLDNIRCCPIVSKDGIVYYTSKTYDEPKFYLNAVRATSRGILDSPWSTFRKDEHRRGKFDYPEVTLTSISDTILITEVAGGMGTFDYEWSFDDSIIGTSYSSSSRVDTLIFSSSLYGEFELKVSDYLNCEVIVNHTRNNTYVYLWAYMKALLDLPSPCDSTGTEIPDTATFHLEVRNNEVFVRDFSTKDSIGGALVMALRGSEYSIGNTNDSGVFSDSLLNIVDSTYILVTKPGYIPQIVYPSGNLLRSDTIRSDIKIYGDMIVQANTELYVEPGGRVFFSSDLDTSRGGIDSTLIEILVKGTLIANGDSSAPVVFVPDTTDTSGSHWSGIVVQDSGSVVMDYAELEYCDYGVYGSDGGPISLSNVTLKGGAEIDVDYTQSNASKTIQLDNITTDGDITIKYHDGSSWIKNSDFDLENSAILIMNSIDTLDVYNCEFNPFTKSGISARNSSKLLIENCLFKNGDSKVAAIELDNSSARMYNSTIDSCDVGVYIANGSSFWAGDTLSEDGQAGNVIQNCVSYLVRNVNSSTPVAYCQNVFWGDSAGPDLNLIDESGADIYYYPWSGYSKYNCKLATVHCVPCEYDSIQDAVDAVSSSTDIVYIHPGTYQPNSSVEVNAPMTITGETETSTIIDGQEIIRLFDTDSLPTGDLYVSDMNIINGFENSATESLRGGGGWRIYDVDGTVHFDNVVFENCSTFYDGGAIRAYDSPLEVTSCIFDGNSSANGAGAIEVTFSDQLAINYSTFMNNYGNAPGAVHIYNKENKVLIENNVFYNNSGDAIGAMEIQDVDSCKIYYNTFYKNSGGRNSGAITLSNSNSDVVLLGNIFYDDTAGTTYEIELSDNGTFDFLYNLIDTTDVLNWSYADNVVGVLDTVPHFICDSCPDLRLDTISTLIDASPDTLDADSLDHDGTPRDSLPDIGAYEYPDGGYGRATTEWNDPTPENIPTIVELGNPVPNPFNSTVRISFLVREESETEITIHDINGKLIRTMIDENVQIGHWETTWDGRDNAMNLMTSGVYFIKLNVNGRTVETKSVTLIK